MPMCSCKTAVSVPYNMSCDSFYGPLIALIAFNVEVL